MSEKRVSKELKHHEAMKKSRFYLFGRALRDAHLATLFEKVWNPLFFMASW